jgi:hypothetical protein
MEKRYTAKDETFYRKLILPEEERGDHAVVPSAGYRWFRSANVVCLEHYRATEKKPMSRFGGTRPAA